MRKVIAALLEGFVIMMIVLICSPIALASTYEEFRNEALVLGIIWAGAQLIKRWGCYRELQ